jgi:hypothetical protein
MNQAMDRIIEKTVEFKKEKETKNTIRYKEISNESIIGTIYLQKSFLPHNIPENVKVTVYIDSNENNYFICSWCCRPVCCVPVHDVVLPYCVALVFVGVSLSFSE